MWLFWCLSWIFRVFSKISSLWIIRAACLLALCSFQTLHSTDSFWGVLPSFTPPGLSPSEHHSTKPKTLGYRHAAFGSSFSEQLYSSNLPGRLQLPQQTVSPVCWSSAAMFAWARPPCTLVWKVPPGRTPGWLEGPFLHLPSLRNQSPVLFVV